MTENKGTDKDKGVLSTLGRGLKAAGKGVLWLTTALIFPLKVKRTNTGLGFKIKPISTIASTLTFMSVWFISAPNASRLYPSAEEVLEQDGISGNIATDISDNADIRAVDLSTLDGKATYLFYDNHVPIHAAYLLPSVFPEAKESYEQRLHDISYTNLSGRTKKGSWDRTCVSFFKKPETDYAHAEELESLGISQEDNALYTMLHEFRHCSKKNMLLYKQKKFYELEADADFSAIEKMSEIRNDPELKKKFLLLLTFNKKGIHNNVLVVDAMMEGTKKPSNKDVLQANKEAFNFLTQTEKTGQSIEDILPFITSPLTKRRVELELEAKKYIEEIKTRRLSSETSAQIHPPEHP